MKTSTIIQISVFFSLFVLIACSENQKGEASGSGDTLTASVPQIDSAALLREDSLKSVAALDSVMGKYTSSQRNKVEYAEGAIDGGPKMVLTISMEKDKPVIKQRFKGTEGAGCGGPTTDATANFIKAEKASEGVYKLLLRKADCKYSDRAGCDEKNVKETTPAENAEFTLTIDMTDAKSIKMSSDAAKTKCLSAWDFEGLTFSKK